MSIVTKKINNKVIFYDKDVGINIEELFSNNAFLTDESQNVEWINDGKLSIGNKKFSKVFKYGRILFFR